MPNALAREWAGRESLNAGRPGPEPFFDGQRGFSSLRDQDSSCFRVFLGVDFSPVR